MNMWLPGDILLKADKMCMAHSLELRVPFWTAKSWSSPSTFPTATASTRTATNRYSATLPTSRCPMSGPPVPKVGFPVPIVYWLREQKWYDYVKEYFTAPWAS